MIKFTQTDKGYEEIEEKLSKLIEVYEEELKEVIIRELSSHLKNRIIRVDYSKGVLYFKIKLRKSDLELIIGECDEMYWIKKSLSISPIHVPRELHNFAFYQKIQQILIACGKIDSDMSIVPCIDIVLP